MKAPYTNHGTIVSLVYSIILVSIAALYISAYSTFFLVWNFRHLVHTKLYLSTKSDPDCYCAAACGSSLWLAGGTRTSAAWCLTVCGAVWLFEVGLSVSGPL